MKRYAQKTKSLQRRKTKFLRLSLSNKSNQRKTYNQKTIIKSLLFKKNSTYETLQLTFNHFTFLIHFDKNCILFIDVNAFKKHNFEIIMYHVKKKNKYRNDLKVLIMSIDVKSILFFKKFFNNVENSY